MSKQIDERVVSMQFDNSRFERNVQTSMSTLDKLKQKLNLSGASKGLESVQSAAKKVDMSGFANNVDTVSSRFSALEVMGVTALANITNSAVNAGKRMLSALTIDPVMDGFSEYEMTLNAVQTTMAGTGKTAEEVEKELKKLDEYADKTVYSTADMLNNLPKFTNAGVELESATKAMIGIANATALAGGDAGKASIAFYNLGQAIGTGYLTRMDYNSINSASIATMEWKNQMVEAAIAQGTLTKVGEDAYKAGNKTLTLQQLFIDGLQEQWATTDVMMKVFGDYGDETTEIGKKSYSAAQDIKTFSQMMESLKATAGTGWKDTWQLIFGDLEGAKKLWTGLSNFISNIISKMADIRNGILESAFGKGFSELGKKISGIIDPVNNTVKTVKNAVDAVKDYGKVVDEIIRGDWGNEEARWDKLTEAGYDWKHAQNLVNEKLGDSTRYATNYKEAQDAVTDSQKKGTEASTKLSKADANRIADLCKLTDAQLLELGYTKEQIEAFRELEKTAKKLGLPISEFIQKIDEIDGRWLLLEAFANVGRSLTGVFKAMKTAWQEIFNPDNESMVAKISQKLFDLIAAFHKFTRSLLLTDTETGKLNANGEKLKRTFKGIFAIFDIIATVVGGPLKIAFKILTQILGAFDLNILDVTAVIGDIIVKFRDWLKRTLDFTGVIKKLTPYLKKAVEAIKEWFAGMKDTAVVKTVSEYTKSAAKSVKEWFATLKDNGVLSTFVSYAKKAGAVMKEWFAALKETRLFKLLSSYLKSSAGSIKEWFNGLKEADNIPKYIIQGLVNGLKSGIKMAASIVKELAVTILDTVKGLLGIHSPSTEFYDIGKNVILGFFNGIKDFITMIYDLVMAIGGKVIEIVKGFDVGSVITAFVGSGLTLGFVKISSAISALTEPLEGVGEILKNAAKVVKSVSKTIGSVGNWVNAQALKTVAISIAILVGSVALLCLLPVGKVWSSIGAIAALAVILGGLTAAMGKFGPSDGVQFGKMSGLMLSLAASVLLLGIALKVISSIKPEAMEQTLTALGSIVVGMIAIMAAFALFSKKGKGLDQAGAMLFKMAGAIVVMALVVKMFANMTPEAIIQGELAVAGIVGIMALMMLITKIGNFKKVSDMLLKMSAAIAILALVVKMFANMTPEAIIQGELAVAGIVGIMALMMLITKIGNFKKVGSMLSQLALSIAILGLVVGILGTMDPSTILQGELAIAGLVVIISGLMLAVKLFGKDAAGIGKTILLISVAIALMAGVAVLLGMVSEENLKKGVAAVAVLAILAAGLVAVTKFAGNDCYKSMIGIAIAIGVMAAAVAVLSFIDPGKLIVATLAMSLLIGMLSLLVKATGKANGSLGVLIVITVAMGMMGAILLLLAKMPIENTIGAAVSLSGLLLVMTGVLYILGKIKGSVSDAVGGVIGLLLLCVPLVAVAGILCMMKNVNNALTNAQALSVLMLAMSVVLGIATICGTFISSAILGVAALLLLCIPLVAVAGILCMIDGLSNAMVNAMALALLISTLGDVCFKLALVGPLALIGVAAVTALTGLIIAVGVLAVAIGALMESCPALESFVDTGLAIMIKLAGGIGEMIGAFVSGVFTQIADSLPGIGLCLSQFMVNATPFIVGAKLVDESVATGAGILVGAILALTVANFIKGITDLLPFVGSFADLGTQLSQFMINSTAFIAGAKMIDPGSVEAVKTLVEAILLITAANFLESITSFLTGSSSIEAFGTQLKQLGTGLRGFIDALGPVDEGQLASAGRAAEIIKTLASASSEIPNSGGLLADIVGDNDMGFWAAQLPVMAGGIANFTKTLTDAKLSAESVTLAENAAKIVKELASAAAEIPNSGGLLADLVGDNEFGTWAAELPNVGEGIAGFTTAIAEAKLDGNSVELAKKAAAIVKELASAAEAVPNSGGFLAGLVGDNEFSTWAAELPNIGKGVAGFASNLGEFTKGKLETVKAGTNAVKVISEMSKEYGSISDFGDFTNFGDGMVTLAEYIVEFCGTLYDSVSMKTINASVKKVEAVIKLSQSVASHNVEACKTFGESLVVIAEDGVNEFVNAFTSDDPVKDIKSAAEDMLDSYIDGAEEKQDDVTEAFQDIAETAADEIATKDIKEDFETAGKNVATGFANGIKNNKKLATDAGSALGKAALKAAKEALDENSPSKEMYQVGDFAGIGFVNALYDNVSRAYKAGTRVADSAKVGISEAVARISDIVNSDIDAQPTIRPVLDLSDVRAGAGSINALFSGRTLSVNTQSVGAISASMNRRQNGGNSDVISAINSLKDSVRGSSGNTYNINGITYDDGSNVSDAVSALIRAAKIERRV